MTGKKKWLRVPIKELIQTPTLNGFWQLMANRYWVIDKDDNALFFKDYASPQCNSHEAIAKTFITNSSNEHPGVRIEYIDKAWLEHDCHDYL